MVLYMGTRDFMLSLVVSVVFVYGMKMLSGLKEGMFGGRWTPGGSSYSAPSYSAPSRPSGPPRGPPRPPLPSGPLGFPLHFGGPSGGPGSRPGAMLPSAEPIPSGLSGPSVQELAKKAKGQKIIDAFKSLGINLPIDPLKVADEPNRKIILDDARNSNLSKDEKNTFKQILGFDKEKGYSVLELIVFDYLKNTIGAASVMNASNSDRNVTKFMCDGPLLNYLKQAIIYPYTDLSSQCQTNLLANEAALSSNFGITPKDLEDAKKIRLARVFKDYIKNQSTFIDKPTENIYSMVNMGFQDMIYDYFTPQVDPLTKELDTLTKELKPLSEKLNSLSEKLNSLSEKIEKATTLDDYNSYVNDYKSYVNDYKSYYDKYKPYYDKYKKSFNKYTSLINKMDDLLKIYKQTLNKYNNDNCGWMNYDKSIN